MSGATWSPSCTYHLMLNLKLTPPPHTFQSMTHFSHTPLFQCTTSTYAIQTDSNRRLQQYPKTFPHIQTIFEDNMHIDQPTEWKPDSYRHHKSQHSPGDRQPTLHTQSTRHLHFEFNDRRSRHNSKASLFFSSVCWPISSFKFRRQNQIWLSTKKSGSPSLKSVFPSILLLSFSLSRATLDFDPTSGIPNPLTSPLLHSLPSLCARQYYCYLSTYSSGWEGVL